MNKLLSCISVGESDDRSVRAVNVLQWAEKKSRKSGRRNETMTHR